ncbi:hypothetical protein FRAHR75_240040 [Frankia sp. Hr75.2]|nr:hypothetical protein FRAHR75_240040 [Frankia sp. Hr75.2]
MTSRMRMLSHPGPGAGHGTPESTPDPTNKRPGRGASGRAAPVPGAIAPDRHTPWANCACG